MKPPQEPSVQLPKLLIVDDDPGIVSQLRLALRKEYEVHAANDPETAWTAVQVERPELVTLDLALDGVSPETGFSVLQRCITFDPFLKIVLITGNDNEPNALRAVDFGAADFLGKPVDVHQLKVILQRQLSKARLERRNAELRDIELLRQLGEERSFGALVGQSPAMRAVYQKIQRVAAVDVEVLILGDSGTGKELVAKEIRRLSARAEKPFVTIDSTAIPANLLESELFGHERGSFTDARESRMGRLQMADGGIIFFDEIGELPLLLQVKLLRFLQEHEVERVGGRGAIKLDVRVIAATSRNLEEEVREGHFRQDLYYRLTAVEIKLPPLCRRGEDVLLLAQYMLERYSSTFNRGRMSFTPKARLVMRQHAWPGNVRELDKRIKGAVALASGRVIDASDLELEAVEPDRATSLKDARQESERDAICRALRQTGGNVSKAAELLRIARPSLYEHLTKLRIDPHIYKPRAARDAERS